MKKLFSLLLVATGSFLSTNAQVTPPLGPPPIPQHATAVELGLGLFIDAIKNNIQTTVLRVNHSIDSMSSSTNVKARLSHSIQVQTPFMAYTTSSQRPNHKYGKIVFKVTYTISGISYHSIPYFDRRLFQDVTIGFSCNQWYTDNGTPMLGVAVEKPMLDEASLGEQALNFFIGNTLTNLVDRKLREIVSGIGGGGSTALPGGKCNCMSLAAGSAPGFTDWSIRFAYVPPKRIETFSNNVTVSLKSIKRLTIIDLPDPVEESINLEFYANHKSIVIPVNRIKAGDEQQLNNAVITMARPGDNDMLVLIGNVTVTAGGETFSNSMLFKKDRNFGIGTHKFIVVRSFIKTPLPGPDGRKPKPYVVYRPHYEITLHVSGDGMGMGGFN